MDGWAVLARKSICWEAVALATVGPRINVQSAAGLCFAGQAIWAALLTQRTIEEAVKAAGIDP